jgi:hypothetical protein
LASVDLEASNLVIVGQVRDLGLLQHADGGRLIVVARNDEPLQILRPLRLGSAQRGGLVNTP